MSDFKNTIKKLGANLFGSKFTTPHRMTKDTSRDREMVAWKGDTFPTYKQDIVDAFSPVSVYKEFENNVPEEVLALTHQKAKENKPTVTQEQPEISEMRPQDIKYLEETLLPLTRKYNIPDQLAASQWAIEGGRKTTGIQATNPLGLLWEGKLHPYETLENAVADYDRTLRSIFGYNKGLVEGKGVMPEIDFTQYTPEDIAWTLMFTDLADRRATELNAEGKPDPLYGDPSASGYRYEAHSEIPDYVSLLKKTPEWKYFSNR